MFLSLQVSSKMSLIDKLSTTFWQEVQNSLISDGKKSCSKTVFFSQRSMCYFSLQYVSIFKRISDENYENNQQDVAKDFEQFRHCPSRRTETSSQRLD